jgi:hypothetical protein
MEKIEVIIIGAGAAGLMCAISAASLDRKVLVLEKTNKVGKKILMSGGGRCNFTNYFIEPENYLSENPHFCKSALARYTQYDFIDLVNRYQLEYHEKTKGQLFCDHRSKDILDILLQECEKNQVEIKLKSIINQIEKTSDGFLINTNLGIFQSDSLVIATGGLSIPSLGSSDFGYQVAEQFGLKIIQQKASLVPFILSKKDQSKIKDLPGISSEVIVKNHKKSFRDYLLFTHQGLSGPAILQISNYWDKRDEIIINFFPDLNLEESLKKWRDDGVKLEIKNKLSQLLPKRLVQSFLSQFNLTKPVCDHSNQELEKIASTFTSWKLIPENTEGYKTAEVTRGGVDTNELSSKTFESKKVKGLYFIGEVLDVTGWLGGYNFQWAWSSGWCAGRYV